MAAALVGLGAWVIVDRTTSSSGVSATGSTPELASPAIVAMLKDRLAALNRLDAKAESAFFTPDAALNDVLSGSPWALQPVITGNDQIARYIVGLGRTFGGRMTLNSVPPILQYGQTVVEPLAFPGDKEPTILVVYRLTPDGKISYEWVLPAGNAVTDFG